MNKSKYLIKSKKVIDMLFIGGLLTCSLTANAQVNEAHETTSLTTSSEDIQYAVENYLSEIHNQLYDRFGEDIRIEQNITTPDKRLALAHCKENLIISNYSNRHKGRINLKVSCNQPTWSTYVPVEIAIFTPVVTALNGLSRGDIITQHDLSINEVDVSLVRGQFFRNAHTIIGKEAKRNLKSGDILLDRHIQFPIVVSKGEQIFLTATTGSLNVKIPVTALRNGRVGDAIRVRNESSKRVISAKVTAPGQAVVAM